jgi:hypothetical protein
MLRLLLVVEYLVQGVVDGEESGAGACATRVGVLGGVMGDELAGLRETCGCLRLRIYQDSEYNKVYKLSSSYHLLKSLIVTQTRVVYRYGTGTGTDSFPVVQELCIREFVALRHLQLIFPYMLPAE